MFFDALLDLFVKFAVFKLDFFQTCLDLLELFPDTLSLGPAHVFQVLQIARFVRFQAEGDAVRAKNLLALGAEVTILHTLVLHALVAALNDELCAPLLGQSVPDEAREGCLLAVGAFGLAVSLEF